MSVSFYIISLLLSLCFLQTSLHALPAPLRSPPSPFRFIINSPIDGATWEVGSLRSVTWDSSLMPEGSTIDAALMHHEMKQSFLVRRYTLAQSGSCSLNLPPEVKPGTYSLLLTVYEKRTATVLGRSLVPMIHIVERGLPKTSRQVQASSPAVPASRNPQGRKDTRDERALLQPLAAIKSKSDGTAASSNLNTALDQEKIHLINETGGKVRVRRAPYTFGWKVPDALRDVPNARADIFLVKSGNHPAGTVERALTTNLSAHAGFHVVQLPMDLVSQVEYRLQIVISGAGRTFVGSSRAFTTTPPAFAG